MGNLFKELLGAAFLGAAYRNWKALTNTKKITTINKFESGDSIIERKSNSVFGGAFRGMFEYLFIKGAYWGLGEKLNDLARKYGDEFVNYIKRIIP